MTASTHKNRIRAFDMRQGGGVLGRRGHGRLGIAVTTTTATTEHLALHRGFVAHAAFDRGSIENARITSSADGREAAVPDVLRDDRRSDDPGRGQSGGRKTGRRGWGPAPIREEVDLFSEE